MAEERYWVCIHDRAVREAGAAIGINSKVQIVIWAAFAAFIVFALFFWGSQDAARDELIVRAVAAGIVILLFPLVYLWKLISLPPSVQKEERDSLRGEIMKLQEQIDSLKLEGPKFSYFWNDIIFGDDEENLGTAVVSAFFTVVNSGTPSVVLDWQMHVKFADHSFPFVVYAPDNLRILIPGTKMVQHFQKEQSLIILGSQPIPSGGMISGFLSGSCPKALADRIRSEPSSLQIFFRDVRGKRYLLPSRPQSKIEPAGGAAIPNPAVRYSVVPISDGTFPDAKAVQDTTPLRPSPSNDG